MPTCILVAEPEPHVRRVLRFILEAAGHEVLAVDSGEEAWLRLASFQPDLVLAGASLPGLDGVTLLQSMRSRPEFTGVPVIILTAETQAQSRARALSFGANDVLVKPFDHEELVLRVAAVLARTQFQRRTIALAHAAPAQDAATARALEPACS
ncbi:MAG TPA: response regulator transcription factor [Candidatus Krumholzibacteria bacterium]|nr:response regulator transcription factor [Candidatus Krumholzibacteria bacterium]